jgi:acetyl esterase/lipase
MIDTSLKRYGKFFCALFSSVLLCSCSGADILDTWIPQTGYQKFKDIAYGHHPRQKLDIYVPEGASLKTPVIVFFYGGSWKKGSKDEYRFVGQAFATKGYITVIADYRLYPEVYFPEFMQDSAAAFVWVHEHIKNYGGDAQKLFVAGHSAGAYNAVMLSLDDTYLSAAGGSREWIKGTIGLAGPYDFLPFTDKDVIAVFSKKPAELTQPIHFAHAGAPPMLLLTGNADTDVYPKNTINLAKKLREYSNDVTTHTYSGVAHIGIILALADGFRSKAPTLSDIDMFITTVLRKEQP